MYMFSAIERKIDHDVDGSALELVAVAPEYAYDDSIW